MVDNLLAFKTKKKATSCAFLVAFVLFLGINALTACAVPLTISGLNNETISKRSEESSQEGTWSFWVARQYLKQEKAPPVVMLGSSLIGSATFTADSVTTKGLRDCVTDRRAATLEKDLRHWLGTPTEVYNASLPGSMASDALLITRSLFRPDNKPSLVIIGVNPRDFIDNTMNSPSDTEPFQFFSRYVPLGNLAKAAFSDPFSYMDWGVKQYVPLNRLKARWSGLVAQAMHYGIDEKTEHPKTLVSHLNQKRSITQVILGGGLDVRKGEWLIPYPMPYGFQDNSIEYMRRYKNSKTPLFKQEQRFFNAFLDYLKNENIKVLVINMPGTQPNRALLPQTFWDEFRLYLTSTCTKYGADYLDLSDDPRFVISDYLDTVHLNSAGGTRFFNIVAGKIGSTPSLSAAALPQRMPSELRTNIKTSAVQNNWQ